MEADPSFIVTIVDTTVVLGPTTTLLRTPTGPHLLPAVMPPGFDDMVTWTHSPSNAHGITWNGPEGQTINMYAEANHGVDALSNGMSWSFQVFDTPVGRVFASVDATDASFVQVGLVIDDQVINIEAHNVADDADWNRRIVG